MQPSLTMDKQTILRVEAKRDDELLPMNAMQGNIGDFDITVARDGAETRDNLFSTGACNDRNIKIKPQF